MQSFADMTADLSDEVGAHVSTEGGVQNAPARAREIGAAVLQLFTKQPSRWAEPKIDDETAADFADERATHGIRVAGAYDSYLINLSSPDRRLWRMSQRSFEAELKRCESLGLDFLVTHPGNAVDGDHEAGLERNARVRLRPSTNWLYEIVPGPRPVVYSRSVRAADLGALRSGLKA